MTKQEIEVLEEFPDEKLLMVQERPGFADMANYKLAEIIPEDFDLQKRKKILRDANKYIWDDPYLFKIEANQLSR